ncbi:MAG TPA: TetR/AcrR family transcriptional regulator [Acidimicrobiia bacterium]|nr:TetR/AcrR family transcriptional regulator [Acidimicrobiia bacterium]
MVDREPTTREVIMEAALQTLRHEGSAGASARSIAARGGFNQALIFYHFGSLEKLFIEAADRASARQVDRYREAAQGVTTLSGLVDLARRLHHDDQESGAVTIVTQLMASAVSHPELGRAVLSGFRRWIDLVEELVEGSLEGSPLAAMIPKRQAAYAIAAVFLGMELMTGLDPTQSEAEATLEAMGSLAAVFESWFGTA